jgi:hypothetical protein
LVATERICTSLVAATVKSGGMALRGFAPLGCMVQGTTEEKIIPAGRSGALGDFCVARIFIQSAFRPRIIASPQD